MHAARLWLLFFLSSQQKLTLAQCLAIICAWRVRDPCAHRPHTDQQTWVTSRTDANYAPVLYNPLLIRLLRQCSSLHSIEWNTIISLLQHVYFFFFLSVPSVLLAHPSSTKMSTAPSTAQYVAVQMYTFNRNARWRSTSNYITSTIALLAKSRPEYGSPVLFFLVVLESLSVQISGIY